MSIYYCSTISCNSVSSAPICSSCSTRLICVWCNHTDTPEFKWKTRPEGPCCDSCWPADMATHTFFCAETECGNEVAQSGHICKDCQDAQLTREPKEWSDCCPDCGDTGPTMLGMDHCLSCWMKRCRGCTPSACSGCGINVPGDQDMCDGCEEQYMPHTRCCDGNPMCRVCASEYEEPCRGCGDSCLPSPEGYCALCYDVRFGTADLEKTIHEIEERLRSPRAMTKDQRDDWIWILQNRRADLAEMQRRA